MRIFAGLQVQDGVDRDSSGTNDFRSVALVYGSMDRVVAQTLHKNGTFIAQKLPVLSAYLTGIELKPENRQAPNHVDNTIYTNQSDGIKHSLSRVMPVPYMGTIDLYIYSSNSTMKYQLLEQILCMFNPSITLQKSDDINDWTNLTEVELVGIATEENVPVGTEERVIVDVLSFTFDFYLNVPFQTSSSVIEQITLNVRDNTIVIDGIDMDTVVIP
jgi:hypothetical protein